MVRRGSQGGPVCSEFGRGLSEMGASPEVAALCLAHVCTLEEGGAGHGLPVLLHLLLGGEEGGGEECSAA